ncbi:MAG: tagaturonate epimerase family protein [Spirochaetia bacterium]
MEGIARLVVSSGLPEAGADQLAALKAGSGPWIVGEGRRIYRHSLRLQGGILYFIASAGSEKHLYLVGTSPIRTDLAGTSATFGALHMRRAELSTENAGILHALFPFTAPVSLRQRTTTIGCGDRLGLATPGHVRALRGFEAAPVLAQQSVRELTLTRRDFPGIVRDASFMVFQEGYEDGFGADGDHVKSIRDIDTALDAGMPMITLDLTEVMAPQPADWSDSRVDAAFQGLDAGLRERVAAEYEGRRFDMPGCQVAFAPAEARRCALMYGRALSFATEVDRHLREKRGAQYDLEISIDETSTPTLPAHHLFIAAELQRRGVAVTSIAPRFVGEFQKGIDYIGDVEEFARQFAVHCAIARARGGYKISVHSGSDKFSVYPAIGRLSGMRLHVKTAGTSWLQAVRVVARTNPPLFRRMLARAISWFPEASKLYHVTADPAAIPAADGMSDGGLETYLDRQDSRQLLHITYGGILDDPGIRTEFFATLAAGEELHYAAVQEHMEKHLLLLGVPRKVVRGQGVPGQGAP